MEKVKKTLINENLCIIQARMGSTRLPGKVLFKVGGIPLLEYEIKRIRLAKKINKIVVATSVKEADDKIENLCQKIGVDCFRGSEEDVLDRYFECAQNYPEFNNIVRLTGDCPLVDPVIIDKTISFFEKNNYDFAANTMSGKETFPDGMDTEIFKKSVLEEAAKNAKLPSEHEHPDEYILNRKKFSKGYIFAPQNWGHFRLTVDNPEDFEIIKFIIKNSKITDGYFDYISLLTRHPEIMLKNMHIKRNEGMIKAWTKDKIFLKNKRNQHEKIKKELYIEENYS